MWGGPCSGGQWGLLGGLVWILPKRRRGDNSWVDAYHIESSLRNVLIWSFKDRLGSISFGGGGAQSQLSIPATC